MDKDEEERLHAIARAIHRARYAHLEHRICTAAAPMAEADKDKYRWSHPDAAEVKPFFNLVICKCPHCGLVFTSWPKE